MVSRPQGLLLVSGFSTVLVSLCRAGLGQAAGLGLWCRCWKFLQQQVPVHSVGWVFLNKCEGRGPACDVCEKAMSFGNSGEAIMLKGAPIHRRSMGVGLWKKPKGMAVVFRSVDWCCRSAPWLMAQVKPR